MSRGCAGRSRRTPSARFAAPAGQPRRHRLCRTVCVMSSWNTLVCAHVLPTASPVRAVRPTPTMSALSCRAALIAAHSPLVTTTPRKLPTRTILDEARDVLDRRPRRHLLSVAPRAGGRTTRPCSMPGTLKSCMYVNVPVHLPGNVEPRPQACQRSCRGTGILGRVPSDRASSRNACRRSVRHSPGTGRSLA